MTLTSEMNCIMQVKPGTLQKKSNFQINLKDRLNYEMQKKLALHKHIHFKVHFSQFSLTNLKYYTAITYNVKFGGEGPIKKLLFDH